MYYYYSSKPSIRISQFSFSFLYVGNADITLSFFFKGDSSRGDYWGAGGVESSWDCLQVFYSWVRACFSSFYLQFASWSSSNTFTSDNSTAVANYRTRKYPSLTKYCCILSQLTFNILRCKSNDLFLLSIYFLNTSKFILPSIFVNVLIYSKNII